MCGCAAPKFECCHCICSFCVMIGGVGLDTGACCGCYGC